MTSTVRPGRWAIDPETARVGFAGRATRLSPTVRARFGTVTGEVLATRGLGEELEVAVDVTVDVRTMTSGNRAWDELVATVDPFAVEHHPLARYRSTGVTWLGTRAVVDGLLSLRGVERSVRLETEHRLSGCGTRLALRGSGDVDREAFGVRCDIPGASMLVPRRLRLDLDVVAVLEEALVAA